MIQFFFLRNGIRAIFLEISNIKVNLNQKHNIKHQKITAENLRTLITLKLVGYTEIAVKSGIISFIQQAVRKTVIKNDLNMLNYK